MFRPLGLAITLSVLAALGAGCAGIQAPRKPLMSPLSEARTFGYSERSLADDRIEVTYLGPARDVSLDREARAAEIANARALAEDLAMWRAAQVAITRNAKAFRILNRRSDANVEFREWIESYPFGSYYFRRRYRDPRVRPYGIYAYDPFPRVDRAARVQIKATVTIALFKRKQRSTVDPQATSAEMSRKYPNALSAPAQ
jgi:hypothetical protein